MGYLEIARGKEVRTFTIITTTPNEVCVRSTTGCRSFCREAPRAFAQSSDVGQDLTKLLLPWAGPLETYPVSPIVNSPRNESAACAEPIGK